MLLPRLSNNDPQYVTYISEGSVSSERIKFVITCPKQDGISSLAHFGTKLSTKAYCSIGVLSGRRIRLHPTGKITSRGNVLGFGFVCTSKMESEFCGDIRSL